MDERIAFNSMLELIVEKSWGGACYASTAIMHTLLKLADIESIPCIGVVKCVNGDIFDHGWLEVSGKIYDASIAYPTDTSKSTVSDYVNSNGFLGVAKTPNFEYGIDMDLSNEATYVSEKFSNIMNHSPFWESKMDYWSLTQVIAKFHKVIVSKEKLVKIVAESQWNLRRVEIW